MTVLVMASSICITVRVVAVRILLVPIAAVGAKVVEGRPK